MQTTLNLLLNSCKGPLDFIKEINRSRYLIFQLAKRDFKNRYAGSSLGLFWAFMQPIAMMGTLWFVFEFGLKTSHLDNSIPFVVWFFTAMVAWNFFADVLSVNTGVLSEYSFMLKKVDFKPSLLPIVKLISSFAIHMIFLCLLLTILLFNGITPSWHWLQLPYYQIASIYLLLGLSWLTASANIFLKDIQQVVGIILQFGFWFTPIIWDYKILPPSFQPYLKLNPMVYIIEGYRSCLVYKQPIVASGFNSTIYFWVFSTVIFVLGVITFRKLRPHFTDVI